MGAWIEIRCCLYADPLLLVAPFMGAWIEIKIDTAAQKAVESVAPFMVAWIEISKGNGIKKFKAVAPFMGAWIEIDENYDISYLENGRTLYGCVD